ncbi:hypothetical protein AMTR_s00012p00214540 [Amborella trichopoda]|uniref:Amine oxidase n=1 Tax=Amborella trichopoda TaxID=13333 RepID=W1PIP2_AMBTC|nr:hypothetical protein AMTR_s00012p00214540 [Amborella trichopoda]
MPRVEQVGLSGVLMVKASPYKKVPSYQEEADMDGILVSENVIGVVHDHFITFYLDMDVDNSNNSFVKVELAKQETAPGESPWTSYLKAHRRVARTETEAQIRLIDMWLEQSRLSFISSIQPRRLGLETRLVTEWCLLLMLLAYMTTIFSSHIHSHQNWKNLHL